MVYDVGMMTPQEALRTAIRIAGGVGAAAKKLGISRQALSRWNVAPLTRVIQIEQMVSGRITREELRPDLFVRGERSEQEAA